MNAKQGVKGKPFQILGFDLLIDRNLKAWILEVNDHPSLNIYFDNTPPPAFGEEKVYTDEDICQVDFFVKSTLVQDTISLCKKSKEKVAGINKYRSLTRIYPS